MLCLQPNTTKETSASNVILRVKAVTVPVLLLALRARTLSCYKSKCVLLPATQDGTWKGECVSRACTPAHRVNPAQTVPAARQDCTCRVENVELHVRMGEKININFVH